MALPDLKISCDGQPLPDDVEVLDLEIRLEINRVPQATITLLDGSVAERRFAISDGQHFALGSRIKIALGYLADGPAPQPVFQGIVTRHSVSSTAEGCQLKVDCSDKAITMTQRRRSAVYRQAKDAQVWRQLIQAGGLRVGRLASTTVTHPELVQFNVSDWDFMVSRADALGLVVCVDRGVVQVSPLALGEPCRQLDHGLDDCRELELELDAAQQWRSLEVIGWDRARLKPSQPVRANSAKLSIGNSEDQALAESVGGASAQLIHPVPMEAQELHSWADARLAKQRWSLLRGSAVVDGSATHKPLDTVQILGVGERFNGKALVSAVTHRFNADGWSTQLRLGVEAACFARSPDLLEMPAAGLLPAVTGLQIATVQSLRLDPDKELRVEVLLPQLGESSAGTLWARLLTPDAGHGRGFVFRPEPGDEVVIGFLNEDPRQPLILGALFGSKNKPPQPVQTPSDKNDLRALVSRAGSRIVFDDETPALVIETTASGHAGGSYNNRISINEKDKTILIEDQFKNSIRLSDQGIVISSDKDIQLAAKGTVKIKGEGGLQLEGAKTTVKGQQLELTGQSQLNLKGAQVQVAADAQLSLKGGAQTSVNSDGMLAIKGSLVTIN